VPTGPGKRRRRALRQHKNARQTKSYDHPPDPIFAIPKHTEGVPDDRHLLLQEQGCFALGDTGLPIDDKPRGKYEGGGKAHAAARDPVVNDKAHFRLGRPAFVR
jgi:hypothetical protein